MSNTKFYKENFKKSLDTPIFKIIFVSLFIFSLYSVISSGFETPYVDKAILSITGKYEIIFIILILLMNTFNIYEIVESNQFYILRFGKKRKYLNELIGNILYSNSFIFIIYLVFCLTFVNMFSSGINIQIIENYSIYNLAYFVFLVFRNYIVLMIFSVVNIIILKLFRNKIIILLFNVLIMSIYLCMSYSLEAIESILNMSFFIFDYLRIKRYINFGLELSITSLYIMISIVLIDFMKNFFIKHIKQVGK